MNILFTGLNGLVGSSLASKLLDSFSNSHFNLASLARKESFTGDSIPSRVLSAYSFHGDCSNSQDWVNTFSAFEPDLIVHIAQMRHIPALLTALRICNLNPFLIIIGTTGVFSNYSSCSAPYQLSESLLRESQHSFCVLRPSMIYGSSRDKNIHKLYERVLYNKFVPLPNYGASLFQPVYYHDVVFALYLSITMFLDGSLDHRSFFNIPGPISLSLSDIVSEISSIIGINARTFNVPIQPLYLLTSCAAFISKSHFPLSAEQVLRLREDKVYKSDWSLLAPNYSPSTFKEGLSALDREYRGYI